MNRPTNTALTLWAFAVLLAHAHAVQAQTGREAGRVHFLLVFDTQMEGHEGHGVEKDARGLIGALHAGLRAQGLQKRVTITVLQGKTATPEQIMKYYQGVKIGSNDALVFYYSGHGGTETHSGHTLTLHAGSLFRSDLRAAMARHNPRLTVLLTDCCSSYFKFAAEDLSVPPEDVAAAGSVGRVGLPVRQLFFQQKGVVDITAARTGTDAYSFRETGGLFTTSLARLLRCSPTVLDTNHNGFIEWSEFFSQLRRQTHALDRQQVPMAFQLSVRR